MNLLMPHLCRRVIIFVLILCALNSISLLAQNEIRYIEAGIRVNVRSGPSTSYDIIGELGGGEALVVVDQSRDGEWIEIRYGSGRGWVAAEYTTSTRPEVFSDQFTFGEQARVNTTGADTLNVRSTPSVTGQILERVRDGSFVTILDGPREADGFTWWLVVTSRGVQGWVVASADGIQTLIPTGVTGNTSSDSGSTNNLALAQSTVDWVIVQQQPDGGWSDGYSAGSSAGITAELVFALSGLGLDTHQLVGANGDSPIEFLANYVAQNPDMARSQAAKIMIALTAAGENARAFARFNLFDYVVEEFDPTTDYVWDDPATTYGYCLMAAALYTANDGEWVNASENRRAARGIVQGMELLIAEQSERGSWGYHPDTDINTNVTAVCTEAMYIYGTSDAMNAFERGVRFLRSVQNWDGGWPEQPNGNATSESDTNSTALVMQMLFATPEDFDQWDRDAAYDFMYSMLNPSGSVSWRASVRGDNMISTAAYLASMSGYAHSEAHLIGQNQ